MLEITYSMKEEILEINIDKKITDKPSWSPVLDVYNYTLFFIIVKFNSKFYEKEKNIERNKEF